MVSVTNLILISWCPFYIPRHNSLQIFHLRGAVLIATNLLSIGLINTVLSPFYYYGAKLEYQFETSHLGSLPFNKRTYVYTFPA